MTQALTNEQQELWRRLIEENDQAARQELVVRYSRLVKYVAGRLAVGLPHYVDHSDLVSAGLLGLIQAIDNYEPERGNKFETYAVPRIRGAILDELRTQDWFPRSLRRKARQLEEAITNLEIRLGRPATDEELAQELGLSRDELTSLMDEVAVATIVSLDADTDEDDPRGTSLGDFLADPRADGFEEEIAKNQLRRLIANCLEGLPEKEQLVLVLYYYEELTLKEIGEILEVTESRVCQIHTKAILRLRGRIMRSEGRKSLDRISREIRDRRRERRQAPAAQASLNIVASLALPLLLMEVAAALLYWQVPLRT